MSNENSKLDAERELFQAYLDDCQEHDLEPNVAGAFRFALQASSLPVGVPGGYALVPAEPSFETRQALYNSGFEAPDNILDYAYRSVLGAIKIPVEEYRDDTRKPHELSAAGCRCVRFGEGNPHWPCELHAAKKEQADLVAVWRCRIAGGESYAYFPSKRCRFCEPLYAAPTVKANNAQPEVAENTGSHAMANQLQRQGLAVSAEVDGAATPSEASDADDRKCEAPNCGCADAFCKAWPDQDDAAPAVKAEQCMPCGGWGVIAAEPGDPVTACEHCNKAPTLPAAGLADLTAVRCQCCATEYPHDSYDAGFIAGSGMCQVCDAAMPPKDLPAAGSSGEEVEVVGYRFFHVDHGYIFRRTHIYEGNPSLEAHSLMLVAQQERIVATMQQDLDYFSATVRALTETIAELRAALSAQQSDPWAPSGAEYDRAIHANPDAKAWADLFVSTFPGLADKHDLMITWFANAMMAMHDYLRANQSAPERVSVPVEFRKVADKILAKLIRFADCAEDLQQEALNAGLQYVRESDDHYVTGTTEQALDFIRNMIGVDVRLTDAATSLPAAGSAVEEVEVVGYATRGQLELRNLFKQYPGMRIKKERDERYSEPLMTVAQHERIVAALSAQQSAQKSKGDEL